MAQRVMAPMVATAAEARFVAERARAAGVHTVGVMIEIPAAVGARLASVDRATTRQAAPVAAGAPDRARPAVRAALT